MATIRIDDLPILPPRTQDGHSTGVAGGVYPMRSRSRSLTRSVERRGAHNEDYGDESAGLRQDGDFKQKQVSWICTMKRMHTEPMFLAGFQRQNAPLPCLSEHWW